MHTAQGRYFVQESENFSQRKPQKLHILQLPEAEYVEPPLYARHAVFFVFGLLLTFSFFIFCYTICYLRRNSALNLDTKISEAKT